MKLSTCLPVTLVVCACAIAQAAEPVTARIVGDRVNLRARPDRNAEVVGQVTGRDVLTVRSIQDDWVEVTPPPSIELWVHQDFIQDGKSTVEKLNVRAGPGINYNVVGSLAKGEAVTTKGTFNDWIRIAPMASASLWVNKEYVELVLPARKSAPAPMVATTPPPRPKPMVTPPPPVSSTPAKPPAPPSDLVLIPLEGQGRSVEREGELKPAPYVMNRPSAFRLIQRSGGRIDTICYLRGNTVQLESMLGQRLKVRGREYWTQGVREPIVVVEGIETRSSSAVP